MGNSRSEQSRLAAQRNRPMESGHPLGVGGGVGGPNFNVWRGLFTLCRNLDLVRSKSAAQSVRVGGESNSFEESPTSRSAYAPLKYPHPREGA